MPEAPAPTKPALKKGDARWFFGQLAIIRATAADTDGAYTLVEVESPPGFEAPLPAESMTPPPPEVVPPENAAELVQRFGGELLG